MKDPNPVLFYEPDGPYGFLSNFATYPITVDGEKWASTEHYYQSKKFVETQYSDQIKFAGSPDEAFKLSRVFVDQVRDDWDTIKFSVMKKAIIEKFSQHPKLAFLLLNTEEHELREHSHKDSYWGDGGDGNGLNKLGIILMEVREHLEKLEPYSLIRYVDSSKLPTEWGTFNIHGFFETATQKEHVALTLGEWSPESAVLTRMHSECLTGDAFASMRCDCGYQLRKSLELIAKEGSGVLLYLRQEGRGIGLLNKIKAYHLQDDGCDTIEANLNLGLEADMRRYDFVEGMLSFFGIRKIRLLTNNTDKINSLKKVNIDISERVPMVEGINPYNFDYVDTKARKMGHKIDMALERHRFR
ncbi:MAG: GTP cyclohydrolase II [Kangiellaceae bacterium]|nr:GTP cyclohydrolase II [Kangiellaceae bacterium]MCW9017172.1 GTP cyclohydrolase II [Kangiellaceae bacterium]